MPQKQLQVLSDYIRFLEAEGTSPATLKQYTSDLTQFFKWLQRSKGEASLIIVKNLSEEDFLSYINFISEKDYADPTYRRLLSVLKRFLSHHNINTSFLLNKSKERPLRALNDKDFVSDEELITLLTSMQQSSDSVARDYLIDRNLAIVCLIRFYGLTPADISSISMKDINLAQGVINIKSADNERRFVLQDPHMQYIRDYRNSIDEKVRPRYRTEDPLFVSFFNFKLEFLFDFKNSLPQRLSVRAIQEMIKDEMLSAGLRKISAQQLRNSCILDHLQNGHTAEEILSYFNLSSAYSVKRFKKYLILKNT